MAFSASYDPFASIDEAQNAWEYNFDDTYDGLADHLEEAGDDLNDETFGGGIDVSKDFDFGGRSAKVADTIDEEWMVYNRQHPQRTSQPTQRQPPTRSQPSEDYPRRENFAYGSQASRSPQRQWFEGPIPDLQPAASLWQMGSQSSLGPSIASAHQEIQPSPQKKFLSLEEVEAQLMSPARSPAAAGGPSTDGSLRPPQYPRTWQRSPDAAVHPTRQPLPPQANQGFNRPQPPIRQRPSQYNEASYPQTSPFPPPVQPPMSYSPPQRGQYAMPQPPQNRMPPPPGMMHQQVPERQTSHPETQHQMPGGQRHAVPQHILRRSPPPPRQLHHPRPQANVDVAAVEADQRTAASRQPAQSLTAVMQEQKSRAAVEENKRLRRIQKINALSRDNGLMSPSDKNYITRIQLQQLVTEDPYAEDFYYQVHSTIRMRNNPQQPLDQFAQTYVVQGKGGRGRQRKDNPLPRMQQQVQRAVAAAKARPRATQLSLEGALGKISFKSVKNPRQVLMVKKSEPASESSHRAPKETTEGDKKKALRTIENTYDLLLDLEEAERIKPKDPAPGEQEDLAAESWRQKMSGLVTALWSQLQVMAPIDRASTQTHPFIAIFDYAKGKRLMPRIFRKIDTEQRLTVLTMIIAHLEALDVVKASVTQTVNATLSPAVREEIEIFTQSVLPPLLGYVAEAPMPIIIGLLGILMEQNDIVFISKSRVGLAFMTMLISRAEIVRQAGETSVEESAQWTAAFNTLFSSLEGNFLYIFPTNTNFVNDVYVWQFLASVAVGASMEQQHLLVAEVRDKVLDNVISSKTLPPDLAAGKIANTNLFLHAMGLDTEQLQV